ncbi:potassium channel family protein [Sphingosinicella rhizophila]|uniref:Potassium channel family protein n=1 Tax=Sphingosinicella rhizophila TaxID=3050082 RepID=A0ABU3Q7M8_9SPHN|nr:potassium channel family protein [Sphingosinicella sp. GR2756]MDT9599386.1 potassium channel family protein [Sphingosinicella sp. GR2756]
MNLLLTLAGVAIVLVTTADVFFTVLFPASRHGPVRKPLSSAVWLLFRLGGGLLHGRRRRNFLSYSGPVVISATLLGWFLLLNAGFALIFKPALGTAILAGSGPTETSWAAAFYYSGFNITTLGVGDLKPEADAYRLLTVAAAALGFAYFSMSITYFLSVYSHLTGRNAFAQGLHHLTGRSGDAAALIARFAGSGTLDDARQHVSAKADFLRQIHQSHMFYPVLRYFHYRDPSYALPRILLIALDTAALIRSALDPHRYRRLLHSTGIAELIEAADDLLTGLTSDNKAHLPAAAEAADWHRRFDEAWALLKDAGLCLRADQAAAARMYVAERARWNQPLRALADFMLYEWATIEHERSQDTASPGGTKVE